MARPVPERERPAVTMRRLLALVALLFAASVEGASLPTPTLACNAGAVDNTTCDAVTTGSVTITNMTHLVAGDLLVGYCFNADGATGLSLSGSFTEVSEIVSNTLRAALYYKIAGDSEGTTYTLTLTGGGTAAASGCLLSAFASIAQSSPLDTSGTTTGNGTAITLPSLTTAADNALLYYVCGTNGAASTYTPPAGYTEEMDPANGATQGRSLQASAGSTGTKSVTASVSGDYACYHAAFKYNTAGVRIYLPSSGAPAVSPTFGSVWEESDNADRIAAVFTRGSTAMTDKTENEALNDTATEDRLNRQYAIQIGAQTISGVLKCTVRSVESNGAADYLAALYVQLADSTGALTSEVLLDSTGKSGTTDEFPTTAAARNYPRKGDAHTMTSQTSADNDYLILEFGIRGNNTATTARTGTQRFGDTAATAEDRDDAETADNHPWCDFLGGLSAPAPPSCTSSIALLGVGCR